MYNSGNELNVNNDIKIYNHDNYIRNDDTITLIHNMIIME